MSWHGNKMFNSRRCVFCRTLSLSSFNDLRSKLANKALFIGESLLTSLLTTYLIEAVAVYMSLMQKLKEQIKLSNLCNFQLFASSIEGNISHQKLRICWVAKKLKRHTSPVKFRVFRRKFRKKLFDVLGSKFQRKLKLLCPFNIQSFHFIRVFR